ncbi:MAG: NAD(P)-binding protein [Pseudomonadales bacterium]
MKNSITRRDFLNGAALTLAAGATLSPRDLLATGKITAAEDAIAGDYYPPTLTGMRGSHDGAFEVAHDLAWRGIKPDSYQRLDEEYDLVIVGGGLSGLAAAYQYRQKAGPESKILILDNHDDFGGHAKRNEFHTEDRMLLASGGSINLEEYNFSKDVNRFLEEIGIDLTKLDAAREPGYALADVSSSYGLFLNEEQYGRARSVEGRWTSAWLGKVDCREMISRLDLPAEQEQRLVALVEGEKDLLDDHSLLEAKRYIETTSYEEFLSERAGLTPATITLLDAFPKLYWGLGPECPLVAEAVMTGLPGLKSLGLTGKLVSKVMAYASDGLKSPTFPDGNASVARLLVRHLIPEVAPGNTMEDIVTARFEYSKLDQPESPIRLRLNSTAVHAVNVDGGVEASYVERRGEDKQAYTVRGKHCILACYNGIIPHLCPELPEAQKENLKYGVKIPLIMANVLLRSGGAVNATGPAQHFCPGNFFSAVTKPPPVNLGDYQDQSNGRGPIVLWMAHAPSPRNDGNQTARDLYRLGRHRLYGTPFATYEDEIKKQLTAMFGAQGFDAERDIEAITVNRWSHGYTYDYMDRYDPDWKSGQAPHELGRAPIGRISIANSDSESSPYVHGAIEAALRAVSEIT